MHVKHIVRAPPGGPQKGHASEGPQNDSFVSSSWRVHPGEADCKVQSSFCADDHYSNISNTLCVCIYKEIFICPKIANQLG